MAKSKIKIRKIIVQYFFYILGSLVTSIIFLLKVTENISLTKTTDFRKLIASSGHELSYCQKTHLFKVF